MIQLKDLRYVRLGTRDPAAAAEYAQKILGLELVRREGGAIYLRGDDRDHTLVYVKGDPADHTVGWEVADPAALDAAGAELEARKIAVRRGRRAECDSRYVEDFLSFADPSGNTHDLVVRPHHSGRRYFPARDCGVWSFSHIGLRTTDAARDEAFWTGVCSARVSDRIGGAAPSHRRSAPQDGAVPSAHAGVQHVNHQVQGVDDVMRSYYFLREQGVRIVFGPGRTRPRARCSSTSKGPTAWCTSTRPACG